MEEAKTPEQILEEHRNRLVAAARVVENMTGIPAQQLSPEHAEAAAKYIDAEQDTPENIGKIAAAHDAAIRRRKLSPDLEADIVEAENNDPEDMLHAAPASYAEMPAITAALTRGAELNELLGISATGVSSPKVRAHAKLLQSLKLKTTISGATQDEGHAHHAKGAYSTVRDHISIYAEGANPHTVIHEATHAATLAKYQRALDIEASGKKPTRQNDVVLLKALADLRTMFAELKAEPSLKGQYAFKNEAEFIAEAMSNDRFQAKLDAIGKPGATRWDRFVNWVAKLLGAKGRTALDEALRVSGQFVSGARPRAGATFSLGSSATLGQSVGAIDGVVAHLGAAWDAAAVNLTTAGNLSMTALKHYLGASTTHHIAEIIRRTKDLVSMAPGFDQYFTANADTEAIRQHLMGANMELLRPMQVELAKLPWKKSREVSAKLGDFGNEVRRLGIDLEKNFSANKAANPELDESLRSYVDGLHRDYKAFATAHPTLAPFIKQGVLLNRKMYILHTAVLAQNIMRQYSGTIQDSKRYLDLIDILKGKARHSAAKNGKPEFYADPQAAGMAADLDKVFAYINDPASLASSDAAAQTEGRKQIAALEKYYRAAVKNPYLHLGRQGEYSVSFVPKDTDIARKKVAAIFANAGVTIGQPKDRSMSSRKVFVRFENKAQMLAIQKQLADIAGDHIEVDQKTGGSTLAAGSIVSTPEGQNTSGVPAFIRTTMENFDKLFEGTAQREKVQAAFRRAFIDTLPESSAQKALVEAKGVLGASNDFVRNFSHRAEGMTSMIANAYSMHSYDEAFRHLRSEVDSLKAYTATGGGNPQAAIKGEAFVHELANRYANSMSPVQSPVIDTIKAFGYHFYLAMSPAFIMTNLVQPYHLTLPYLGGKYGFVATGKELLASSRKAKRVLEATIKAAGTQGAGGILSRLNALTDAELQFENAGLASGEVEAIRGLIASGQLDFTQAHEIGRLADSTDTPAAATRATMVKTLGTLAHYSELVNRITAALTAYNLETGRKGTQESAVAAAIDAVWQTQYDYSDRNMARYMGRHGVLGKVTPLVSSFQNYAFQTTELFTRMTMNAIFDNLTLPAAERAEAKRVARRQLAGVYATSGVLAGAMGTPMVGVAFALANLFSGDDNETGEPNDWKSEIRNWLAEVFGKDVAEVISHGAFRGVGVDISTRVGLDTILPASRFLIDRREFADKVKDGAAGFLGPAFGGATDIVKGASKILDGQLVEGLSQGLPLALRNLVKAGGIASHGYTNTTGNQIPLDVTWADVAIQSTGFTPAKKAEQAEANFAHTVKNTMMVKRKTILSTKAAKEYEREGGVSEETMGELVAFNQAHPEYAIDLGNTLQRRAQGREVAKITGTGIMAPVRGLPQLQRDYSWANTGIEQ